MAMTGTVGLVKVFSATRSKDRELLGERVTSWIRSHPEEQILEAAVLLSSDHSFHCLSIVLICAAST
jgi:hypothetical protein